jgi:type IV pilus assembly protein PilC
VPKFSYTAKNLAGKTLQGELEAANENEARVRLRAMQLLPVKLSLGGRTGAGGKPKTLGGGLFAPKVNSKDLQIFTRQFSTLINAGIPVVDALKILSEGLRPGLLREASSKVKSSIENGKRLADAMAGTQGVFDRLYVNMIKAGEEAGILDTILNRLSVYMEKSEKIKGQVKGALVYPAVILIVAFIVISGILVFIIPKFNEFYSSAGKEPPALTQMVVALSQFMIHKWYVVIGVAIGIPVAIGQYLDTAEGRAAFDAFVLKVPVVGEVALKSAVARLSRTLSTLLSSGVGLIEAIEIAARTAGNGVIENILIRSKDSVTQGRSFSAPLSKERVIPDMVVQMIAIGEQSGTMDIMLGKIADFYEDEVEAAVKAMTSLIEPLMMVFLGGIIAVLVIAMYLPIFNMGDIVGGG